jgi:hypothetical protein
MPGMGNWKKASLSECGRKFTTTNNPAANYTAWSPLRRRLGVENKEASHPNQRVCGGPSVKIKHDCFGVCLCRALIVGQLFSHACVCQSFSPQQRHYLCMSRRQLAFFRSQRHPLQQQKRPSQPSSPHAAEQQGPANARWVNEDDMPEVLTVRSSYNPSKSIRTGIPPGCRSIHSAKCGSG